VGFFHGEFFLIFLMPLFYFSEKMESRKVMIVLSALIAFAWAYPNNVPAIPEVCSKMIPGHGPAPQKSKSPFTLEVSTTAVKGGNNVKGEPII
jgi:hypothetical protein